MPQSYIEYSSGLTATTFSVPFKYLNIDDVNVVGYNGVSWTPLTIASRSEAANTVTLSVAPSAYNKIRVYRQSTSNQLVDFQAGARLTESELDTAYNQSLFVAQEVSEDASTNQFQQIRDASAAAGNSLSNFSSEAFTANSGGTQTEFSLTAFTPETTVPEAFLVSIDGVIQSPTDAYTISRSPAKVTLTSAAPANAKVVIVTTASAAGSAANLFLSTDGKLGIGTTSPAQKLQVENGKVKIINNDTVFPNNLDGGLVQLSSTNAVGRLSMDTNELVCNDDFTIRVFNGKVLTLAQVNAAGNNSSPKLTIDSSGDINIGNLKYTGTLTDISDTRLKENVEDLNNSLDKISQLNGKSYTMIEDETSTEELGFIAQEVQEVFPEIVKEHNEEDDYLSIAYIQLIAPMVEAIKELKSENESLKARVEALENA